MLTLRPRPRSELRALRRAEDPPAVVEIAFIGAGDDGDGWTSSAWLRLLSAARVLLPLAAVLAVAILERPVGHHGIPAVEAVDTGGAHSLASDPIAAASRGPWRCMTITLAASDHAYIRAAHNGPSPCSRDQTTTILHDVEGQWRVLLNAVSYRCPVASVPVAIQAELGVCPRKFVGRQASSST